MGRDGNPVDQCDQREPELSERERALRGRPGERSRVALEDLAGEVEQRLATDLATDLETDAADGDGDGEAKHARVVLGTCVDLVVGARRLAGWCEYLQVLAVARLLAAWSGRPPILDERIGPDPCGLGEFADPALADRLQAVVHDLGVFVPAGEHLDTAVLADEFVASEIAAAAGISLTAARTRVAAAAALFLSERLPRTRTLLRAGLLDPTKLTTILKGTAVVADDALCALVEARLIPDPDLALALAGGAPGHVLDTLDPDPETNPDGPGSVLPWVSRATNPKVTKRIARIMAQVDADAAADRAAKARATRHVRTEALPDAMGALTVETGREAITAIVADLDALLATAKANGDPRCPGQIRADELIHRMTLGAFGAPAHPGSNPYSSTNPSNPTNPSNDTNPTGSASPASSPALVGVRALRVSLTMPLATWLGLAQDPGELDGYGPIPAALARQIATDAARGHPTTTTWRCIPIDDVHRTVLGVGDTIPTPRHDPTPRQRDLATTADPLCVWPGCGQRSAGHGVDIDHRIPHHQGGVTCACNLQPLCRRHHRMKGTGLNTALPTPQPAARPDHKQPTQRAEPIEVADLGPRGPVPAGAIDWTTWTARTYRHTPEACQDSALTDDEQRIVAAARIRRFLDPRTHWADADNPGNPANRDSDTVHDLRARLHDLATGLRPASPADHHDNLARPETYTGTESWHFSIDRDRRRHERQAERRAPLPPGTHDTSAEADDRRQISDLTDVPPF